MLVPLPDIPETWEKGQITPIPDLVLPLDQARVVDNGSIPPSPMMASREG